MVLSAAMGVRKAGQSSREPILRKGRFSGRLEGGGGGRGFDDMADHLSILFKTAY